ncbi:hypothetical protein MBLNU459_g2570t2 [Dothideomycetes sp. NU459]
MDKIRVSKVDSVTLCRRGEQFLGTLHLAQHHLIFSYLPPPPPDVPPAAKQRPRELWITYPIISYCTYRPMPPTSRKPPSIRLRCRDFTFVAFQFADEALARDVYDTVKSLTCAVGRPEKLYAFTYDPPPAEKKVNGWHVYDARKEFRRMGVGPKEADRGWRLSEINHDYVYSPTYPSLLAVPSSVSDNVLKHGGVYRSRVRIPALTYLHPVNNCSITRSSQPLVGMLQGKRNPQDERLVAAIFATSRPSTAGTSHASSLSMSDSQSLGDSPDQSTSNPELAISEESASFVGEDKDELTSSHTQSDSTYKPPRVYGSTQRNFIVDARPQVNAYANQATGKGSENMEYYKDATKEFLGIANIHVMRDSLNKVVEAFQHSDYTSLPPNQELLAKSRWLEYISLVLRGADLVARQVGVNHSHVLIHCSDGWDRTSQISALSQICLDPYYRTLEGFIVLVEKDWLSFGHMFRHRSGYLSSEKWFEIENERIAGNRKTDNPTALGSNGGSGNAFENALFTARGFFSKKNDSVESLNADADALEADGSPVQTRGGRGAKHDKYATKPSETSPIFHQFLDATYQLLYQYPDRFEFNERFLRRLLYQLYSCQYGTFLFDSERERMEAKASERTRSVWDYFLSRREQFINEKYDPVVDDKIPGKERLLFPEVRRVRWWSELFGRTDEEMNGTDYAPAVSLPKEPKEPIVTGIENSDIALGTAANGSSPFTQNNPLAGGADRLTAGLANLGFGKRTSPSVASRPRTPTGLSNEVVNDEALTPSPSARREELSFQAFARDNAFRDS